MSNRVKLRFVIGLIFTFFILGLVIEYKIGIIKDIQNDRNEKIWYKPLPEFPSSFNNKAGLSSNKFIEFPLNEDEKFFWRKTLRNRILNEINGELFPTQSTQYKILSAKGTDSLIEQELLITSFDGQLIPARLFIPISNEQNPGILFIPGHSGSQSGMLQLSDEVDSYQNAAARKLAESGFVTLAFELRGFGYLGMPDYPEHNLWAYNALQKGESYKSLILKDTAVATALLKEHPNVDSKRIGITGASYGGEVAVQYGALDKNIKAISFHSYAGNIGVPDDLNNSSTTPHLCHILPGIDSWMTQENWIWLLAPRNIHGIRGIEDKKDFMKNYEIYAMGWNDRSKIKMQIEDGGHEYFTNSSINFFKSNL
tara:strand:- start:370 stop:1476 length:1107 start_codon:yes stop_codon:yes gene_type:complete